MASAKTAQSREGIRQKSSGSIRDGINNTMDALALSILSSMPEFIDRTAEFSVRGRTTEKGYITPMDFSREVITGISDKLNGVDENGVAHRVLDEDIPIIGGMGWGDVYQWTFEAAKGWITANTIGQAYGRGDLLWGKTAVLANQFADTAVTTIDEAQRLGADGKQSMTLGLTRGMLEVSADLLPLDHLLQIGPATTVKDFLKYAAVQGGLEGITDASAEALG